MEWSELQEQFELEAIEPIEWMNEEYKKIRSGRVSISILDNVKVNAYGELMNLNQLSNLQIVERNVFSNTKLDEIFILKSV